MQAWDQAIPLHPPIILVLINQCVTLDPGGESLPNFRQCGQLSSAPWRDGALDTEKSPLRPRMPRSLCRPAIKDKADCRLLASRERRSRSIADSPGMRRTDAASGRVLVRDRGVHPVLRDRVVSPRDGFGIGEYE